MDFTETQGPGTELEREEWEEREAEQIFQLPLSSLLWCLGYTICSHQGPALSEFGEGTVVPLTCVKSVRCLP